MYITPHQTWPSRLTILSLFVSLMLAGHLVHAQTESTTTATTSETDSELPSATSSEDMLAEAEATQDDRTTAVAEERARLEQVDTSSTATLSERSRFRIRNLAANMSNRTDAVIIRQTKIADRLERRADTLDTQGLQTDAARAALATARSNLADAEAIMSNIDTDVYYVLYAQRPTEAWRSVDIIYQAAHDSVRAAHVALRISLNELKNAPPTTPLSTDE